MIKITIYDNDGNECVHELPSKKEVCWDCEGEGWVLNESMRSHAYSSEEFEEAFDEEDDRLEYFRRGGIYDVKCPTCKGANVIDVIDRGACDVEILAEYDRQEEERENRYMERQSEIRYGC